AVADELLGEGEDVFNRLFGEDRPARSDATDDGNQRRFDTRRAVLGRDDDPAQRGGRVFLTDDLDRTSRNGIAAQQPLLLEHLELILHRGWAREADRLSDLAHRRRIARSERLIRIKLMILC